MTDERGEILDANDAAGELLNVPADALRGERLGDLAVEAPIRRLLEALARDAPRSAGSRIVLERPEGGSVRAAIAARRVDAVTVLWMLHRVDPPEEEAVRAVARELERERVLGETIIEQIPAGLVVVSAPGGEVLHWNAEAERILGPLPDARPDARLLARSLERGETVAGERVAVSRADGGEVLLELRSAPVRDRAGRTIAAVAVFADVTSAALRQRAEHEFVANAAHELQTPIAAITSAAEVLVSGAKDDPAARDHFLAHIHREAVRLTRLARALLALARAQSGVEDPRHELVALRPLLDELVVSLPRPGDVTVEVECPPELALVANRDLVGQALASLVSNAVKFTRSGPVVVRAAADSEGRAVIDVADRGPGIPKGAEGRIFDRFYRAPGAEATGFGLGLAIVREAVEVLDGTIRVARTGAEGTTFRIELPGAELVR